MNIEEIYYSLTSNSEVYIPQYLVTLPLNYITWVKHFGFPSHCSLLEFWLILLTELYRTEIRAL